MSTKLHVFIYYIQHYVFLYNNIYISVKQYSYISSQPLNGRGCFIINPSCFSEKLVLAVEDAMISSSI